MKYAIAMLIAFMGGMVMNTIIAIEGPMSFLLLVVSLVASVGIAQEATAIVLEEYDGWRQRSSLWCACFACAFVSHYFWF